MKRNLLFLSLIWLSIIAFAQAPQAFKYQAVARDLSGNPLIDMQISVKISILSGNASGTVVYSELHQTNTNSMGLFNLEVGNPSEALFGNFETIVWGADSYFLKLEIDPTGGTSFQLMGTSQLVSVPYALNSSSLALTSPNGTTFEVTVDDAGNLVANCIPDPTQADAGADQNDVLITKSVLQGNTPVYGVGNWNVITGNGGSIQEPGNPNSQFFGLAGESYELEWAISNSCGSTSDIVSISFDENAVWQCGSPIIDNRDEKLYATAQIGEQCWMAENLNVGARINGVNNQTDNSTIEKYCYNNIDANCDIYGGLYQWDEMMGYTSTQGVQGICPTTGGWHLPTDADYNLLIDFLGGATVAGGKMKSTGNLGAGTGLWPPNSNGTN